ncbi:MAG: hypothetical protein JXA30_10310 [Deltaproteobacteria bacterium]|nr:hypothetical protein [Deltaproteobacteria bacterium]
MKKSIAIPVLHAKSPVLMQSALIIVLLIGCESSSDEGHKGGGKSDATSNLTDASKDSGDESSDSDSSLEQEPIVLPSSNICLSDDDCAGDYCCPLFHYCVERCEQVGQPCSQPNFRCNQGYAEPLCGYVGPDLEKEYAPSGSGAPCVLDEDCLPGFFCAPTLRFCVERCDEEDETCPITGYTCTIPNAYDLFELPMLACVYRKGDPEGSPAAEQTVSLPKATQKQKEDACACMFASEVYPDPSRADACVTNISDKCVVCLQAAIEDTSACGRTQEKAVLSCTDPCSRAVPPPESVQECKDFLRDLQSSLPVSETDCICENCTHWYNLCLVDPDCYDYLVCSFEQNCMGFDCLTPCEEIIGRVLRNSPDSINIAAQVANCSVEAKCR